MSATRVVEQMLDHAANARWERLPEVLTGDFVIVEPASLPYGGEHHGVDGYVALMHRITALFALEFEPDALHALDDSTVLLRMHVTFTGRATRRARRLPVLELLTTRGARVARSEVFVFDTAALLGLLPASSR
jgi:ketosteroid isomerase-like protein